VEGEESEDQEVGREGPGVERVVEMRSEEGWEKGREESLTLLQTQHQQTIHPHQPYP